MTFIEDLGRYGYQRYGVAVSGVMDQYAARFANFLAGNHENAAVLEGVLKGPSLTFSDDTFFAITGAACPYTLNGQPIALWQTQGAKAGDTLSSGFCTQGIRSYIAVAGGIDVPMVMGSRSVNMKGQFGGLNGSPLKQWDILPTGKPFGNAAVRAVKPEYIPQYPPEIDVRVVMGPQDDAFTARGKQTFLNTTYKVSPSSDRMGIRLQGEKIECQAGADIISDGIAFGSVQVPGDGYPIVMMAERQTTGGYTKIATVIVADLMRFAQARPETLVRFHETSLEGALAAYQKLYALYADISGGTYEC
jgi:biotin-dependent carboxylase-like uncharacterized protein